MASNEHGAIKQNVEHHETNISIYYTRETVLYTKSYDALNRDIYRKNNRTEISGKERKSTHGCFGSGSGSGSPE